MDIDRFTNENIVELILNAEDLNQVEWDDAADFVSKLGPSHAALLPKISHILLGSDAEDSSKHLALLALAGIAGWHSSVYRDAIQVLSKSESSELRHLAQISRLFAQKPHS